MPYTMLTMGKSSHVLITACWDLISCTDPPHVLEHAYHMLLYWQLVNSQQDCGEHVILTSVQGSVTRLFHLLRGSTTIL